MREQWDAARAYYEELSRLLDRRLHRMRQLDGRLDRHEVAGSRIEARVREYREEDIASSPPVRPDLRGRDVAIYELNVRLTTALQREAVGATRRRRKRAPKATSQQRRA